MFHTSDYIKFINGKIIDSKKKSLLLESGYKSFTNYFEKKNYEILVVNSDGKLFKKKEWKNSNTFAFKNQEKLIISDKDTRDYAKLNSKSKREKQITVWGNS